MIQTCLTLPNLCFTSLHSLSNAYIFFPVLSPYSLPMFSPCVISLCSLRVLCLYCLSRYSLPVFSVHGSRSCAPARPLSSSSASLLRLRCAQLLQPLPVTSYSSLVIGQSQLHSDQLGSAEAAPMSDHSSCNQSESPWLRPCRSIISFTGPFFTPEVDPG